MMLSRRPNQLVKYVLWILGAGVSCGVLPAHAADPQPYRVEIASSRDGALGATLKATSELQSHLATPLDDPRHGVRASLSVTSTRSFGQPGDAGEVSASSTASEFRIGAGAGFRGLGQAF